jgi:hypothetical protein
MSTELNLLHLIENPIYIGNDSFYKLREVIDVLHIQNSIDCLRRKIQKQMKTEIKTLTKTKAQSHGIQDENNYVQLIKVTAIAFLITAYGDSTKLNAFNYMLKQLVYKSNLLKYNCGFTHNTNESINNFSEYNFNNNNNENNNNENNNNNNIENNNNENNNFSEYNFNNIHYKIY